MAYIVQSSAAKMPGSCWGRYRRVAVIEVESGVDQVAMISDRAKGVVRIVRTWEKLNVGHTERCAYRRALSKARQLAHDLNAQATQSSVDCPQVGSGGYHSYAYVDGDGPCAWCGSQQHRV